MSIFVKFYINFFISIEKTGAHFLAEILGADQVVGHFEILKVSHIPTLLIKDSWGSCQTGTVLRLTVAVVDEVFRWG